MKLEAVKRKRAPRRDAQHRREALLSAAAACFQELGYDVPLEIVADRAGVGRGTLYRNFDDREALALAIFSREVDRFEEILDPTEPIEVTLERLVREGVAAHALFRRIAADLKRSDVNLAALEDLGRRLEQLLAPAVRLACARGDIDGAVTSADLVLVLQMVSGSLHPYLSSDEVSHQINAAMSLLLWGLRPR